MLSCFILLFVLSLLISNILAPHEIYLLLVWRRHVGYNSSLRILRHLESHNKNQKHNSKRKLTGTIENSSCNKTERKIIFAKIQFWFFLSLYHVKWIVGYSGAKGAYHLLMCSQFQNGGENRQQNDGSWWRLKRQINRIDTGNTTKIEQLDIKSYQQNYIVFTL